MNYISSKEREKLSNDPYILSISEIREMIRQNEMDRMETERITDSSKRGESYYKNDGKPGNEKIDNFLLAFFREILYRDAKTDGFIMNYPHGTIITQGEHNSYYRGESQIYPKSQSTIFRSLEGLSDNEKKVYHLVSDLRIAEFQLFLDRFEIVSFWKENYGTVLYEPLAQHYGLETEWLDITSDLDVALFFATCKYDPENKRWSPLEKNDIELNDNTKYGVIFHIPGWNARTTQMIKFSSEEYESNAILPIGYQPFMRCHCQHGYGICMKRPFPLQSDISFEKLYFRQDESFSREIYEKMECGKSVYPREGLNEFDDVIRRIKETVVFGRRALEIAVDRNDRIASVGKARELLESSICKSLFGRKIEIIDEDSSIKVSRQRIRALNRDLYSFSIEKDYGIELFRRNVFYPQQ